jgi:deazaflavin-dependent oxidoreductase (nitroreductase family)
MRDYKLGLFRKAFNFGARALLRAGVAPLGLRLLTTVGRKSGTPHSTPVQIVDLRGTRYLVAPYGRVAWVFNARAAGTVTLSRGRKSETFRIREVDVQEAGPVLKRYVARAPVVLPFFEAKPGSPIEDFLAEAKDHPVFELTSAQ